MGGRAAKMRDKLAQMGYTGVQVSRLFPLYFLSCTCKLSLPLKLLSAGISRELCWVGVPRGPGWKMKNRTCDQDLSRHNNWCLHLLFISISERRRIVFLPRWLGEPWQKCIGRGRRKDCGHLHWMRESLNFLNCTGRNESSAILKLILLCRLVVGSVYLLWIRKDIA